MGVASSPDRLDPEALCHGPVRIAFHATLAPNEVRAYHLDYAVPAAARMGNIPVRWHARIPCSPNHYPTSASTTVTGTLHIDLGLGLGLDLPQREDGNDKFRRRLRWSTGIRRGESAAQRRA